MGSYQGAHGSDGKSEDSLEAEQEPGEEVLDTQGVASLHYTTQRSKLQWGSDPLGLSHKPTSLAVLVQQKRNLMRRLLELLGLYI